MTETTRTAEVEIEIHASPAAVWRALSEAAELRRWFPLDARVEPGPGGKIFLSWGEAFAGEARIDIWEPGKRLRAVDSRRVADGSVVEIATDYHIEARGGGTVLRVVQSGFGRGAEWDAEYDAVSRGWTFELRSLRHYLERHRGEDRQVAWVNVTTSLPSDRIYSLVMGPELLAHQGSVAGLGEGDPYKLVATTGDVFEGTVFINRPPTDFAGTVRGMNDALLRYVHEVGYVWIWLATYGVGEASVEAFRERWRERLERVVGEASASAAPGAGRK